MAYDSHTVAYQIFFILSLIGVGLELFGVIPTTHSFNEFVTAKETNWGIPQFITIPIVRDFIIALVTVLGIYYGMRGIGVITGNLQSIGTDFPTIVKIIALAVVSGVIARIPSIISLAMTLGAIGKAIALFIGMLVFYASWSILFSYTR